LPPGPYGYLEVPPGANAGIRETSARDVVTLWCFITALRECREPWAAKLVPEIESNRAKASVTMWNRVSTAMACPTHRPVSTNPTLSLPQYLTHQVRKRVGPWSNDISYVRFTPESGHRTVFRMCAAECAAHVRFLSAGSRTDVYFGNGCPVYFSAQSSGVIGLSLIA